MADKKFLIAEWLSESSNSVAFTGAGVSTESGISDFRSPGGVWSKSQPVYFQDFLNSPESRYEYWRQKSESHPEFMQAEPNVTHTTLAEWERQGNLRGLITQNIDGLHEVAGNEHILELHGTARHIGCLDCDARFGADEMVQQFLSDDAVPDCPNCSGILKHATISFGQMLKPAVISEAKAWSVECDLFLAMGSSLVVEPAASLPVIAKQNGAKLVIMNRDETPLDSIADIVVNSPLGETMSELRELVAKR